MKAEPVDQQRLLALQDIDLALDRVRHRRATLPESARALEAETSVRMVRDRLTAIAVEVSDLELEQRKADNDVDLVRERAARDRQLLDSGSIGDAKQLVSLQHELESLARRQSELEDIELEVMERLDDAQRRQRELTSEQEVLSRDLDEAVAARDAALAALADEESALDADRAAAAAAVPDDLRALYEKLRSEQAGIGAARLHRGRCEGCRIELTPVDIDRIRQAPAEEVLRCEECRRILVRTAESGL